ncbi:MAG: rhomboid family intramembrane serine protease [Urechidicola sp.]|nr:rhomboid family intramembrane serine protease [Urechidicola sp.]
MFNSTNFKSSFKTASIVEKIIYINVALFIVSLFVNSFIVEWFSLKSGFDIFLTQPWTPITYSFFHGGFPHVLLNMIFLFYIGNLFLNFFNSKQFINYYFLGIITGGIAFLLLNPSGYLVGASAGLMAIIVGIATKIPTYEIRLRLIGGVKLWVIAAFYVGMSLIDLRGENFGGNIAHLGGALIGFVYTKQLEKGVDIGKWFESIINFFATLLKPNKQKPMKTVYKRNNIKRKPTAKETNSNQKKIDAILDKISKSGYDALSKEEKDFLFRSGK